MTSVVHPSANADSRPSVGTFSSILVGGESLLIQCADILRARGHSIHAVVTKASPIAAWAEAEGVRVIPLVPGWEAALRAGEVDYLFSVANLELLPSRALGLARRAAVNFHDGPLPRYAGLNAPVWAIADGQPTHGITWHVMTEQADAGAILVQREFPLTPDERALSLNARCYEAAIDAFRELVSRLESGQTEGSVLPLDLASRHFGHDRPSNGCVLDPTQTAESLDALARALDFGTFPNPIGVPMLRVGSSLVAALGVEVLPTASDAPAGTLLSTSELGLDIATATRAVRVSRLHTADGHPISVASLLQSSGLRVGDRVPLVESAEATALAAVQRKVLRHEAWWVERLASLSALPAPLARVRADAAPVVAREQLDGPVLPDAVRQGPIAPWMLAALFVGRLTGTTDGDIGLVTDTLDALVQDASPWFATAVPIRLSLDAETVVAQAADALRAARDAVAGRGTWSRSVPLRYPSLRHQRGATRLPVVVADGVALAERQVEADLVIGLDAATGRTVWRFAPDVYAAADVAALAERFGAFADAVVAAPAESRVATLPILPAAERTRILSDWNQTAVSVTPQCVHEVILAQAAATPDADALVATDDSLTYAELVRRATRVAHGLIARGVGPDVLVGLYLPRESALVVSLLGTHLAGGAYVPLDPQYPADRIAHMVADSGLRVVLTTRALRGTIPAGSDQMIVCVEDLLEATAGDAPLPPTGVTPAHLAYVIYTSGSTGLPKGVMVEHRQVVNFFAGMDDTIGTGVPGTWLAVTSLSFDISVLELCWTLARGFRVVLAPGDRREAEAAGRLHAARGIGFSLFYFSADENEQRRDKYRLLLEGAKFGDARGFDAVWTPERHFHAFGGLYPNPSVTSAAVAAITSRIAIRAGSCVLPLHHPLRVAEEWSVVDNLSNGRVGISVAAGWQPNDFVLRPASFGVAKDALVRDLATLRALWRGESVDFPHPSGKGEVALRVLPRPVQPELPVWYTTAGNPDSYVLAADLGANVLTHLLGQSLDELAGKIALYREAWRNKGNPGRGHVSLMLHTFLGPDAAIVKEKVRGPLTEYLRTSVGLIKQYASSFPALKKRADGTTADLDFAAMTPEETEALLAYSFERYYETSGLFGTPEQAEELVDRLKGLDVDEIACLIDFGIETDTVLESLESLDQLRARTSAPRVAATSAASWTVPQLIADYGVTHVQCTPSMAAMLAASPDGRAALTRVGTLLVGGEPLPPGLAADLRSLVTDRVFNMYGPTETTIWSTVASVGPGAVHIGRPIANTTCLVLDERREPVPIGVAGELWIGGDGVVRGYHARPALTEERFVTLSVRGRPERAYRTGDLVRWLPDGTLEHLGRLDHQVKIRGYRIELGEIEAAIADDGGVREVAVIDREDVPGDKRLVAYVVGRPGAVLDPEALKARCRARLPEFMVPSHIALLADLPRTPNRKVDRRALPAPESVGRGVTPTTYVAPQNEIESTIASIWCDVLRVPEVGVRDNFFDLGGHSLLAVQVHGRLKQALQRDLAITDLFRFPTVQALAQFLSTAGTSQAPETAAATGASRASARRDAMRRRAGADTAR
jgi:natural product biosynthesis luciferase-like monooxygenase protein